jgi:hypothetical protein
MTLLSKISRTKKRLSDEQWLFRAMTISLFGLFVVITAALRVVTMPARYGVVPLDIPVLQAGVQDPRFHQFTETARDVLLGSTPAVVLTSEAFYFGDLNSFTTTFGDNKTKYIVRHKSGMPQLKPLITEMSDWIFERSKTANIPLSKILVLIPSGDIPMPILTEVVAGLRTSHLFQRVILSTGLN